MLERRPWWKNRWREERHVGAEATETSARNKAESKHRRRERERRRWIQAYWDIYPGRFVSQFGDLMRPPLWLGATESAFPACSSALMVAGVWGGETVLASLIGGELRINAATKRSLEVATWFHRQNVLCGERKIFRWRDKNRVLPPSQADTEVYDCYKNPRIKG